MSPIRPDRCLCRNVLFTPRSSSAMSVREVSLRAGSAIVGQSLPKYRRRDKAESDGCEWRDPDARGTRIHSKQRSARRPAQESHRQQAQQRALERRSKPLQGIRPKLAQQPGGGAVYLLGGAGRPERQAAPDELEAERDYRGRRDIQRKRAVPARPLPQAE